MKICGKILVPIAVASIVLIFGSPTARAFSPDTWTPGPGWTLVWADEFNGPSIDTNNWTYDLGGGGWGNGRGVGK